MSHCSIPLSSLSSSPFQFEREIVRKMASKRSATPVLRKNTTFNRWDTTGEVYGGDDL
jgi:hypothetical protein